MGVSLSSAFRSPSLQARSSVLMSPAAGSPDCAALCIAMDYTAAPGLRKFTAPGVITSRRILRLAGWRTYEIDPDFTCGGRLARHACISTDTKLYRHRPRRPGPIRPALLHHERWLDQWHGGGP